MSKSMNKYHKYKSESGILPGWVKVGALAMGVGVGAVYGPGEQYVRAGNYRLEIQSKQGVYSFLAEDSGTGEKGEFVLKGQKVDKCDDFMVTSLAFRCEANGASFRLGSFSVYFRAFQHVLISGGSLNDSISVASEMPVEMPALNRVYANALVFENTPAVVLQSKLLCSSIVFLKCNKVLLSELASVSADCVFVSDSTVVNRGALKCDYFLPYDDCHLSGFEKAKIGFRKNREKKEMIILEGLDQHDEDSGCFATLNNDGVSWIPFDEKVGVPFACQNDYIFREYNDRKECFYKVQHLKKSICVFVGKVRDVCGSSVPEHEKKVRFCVADSSGKILESLVQGSIKTGWSFTRVICPLRLKEDVPDKISFKLLGQDCKCPRSVIDSGSSIIFLAEID